jgi:hypothetical protein
MSERVKEQMSERAISGTACQIVCHVFGGLIINRLAAYAVARLSDSGRNLSDFGH